MDKMTTSNIIGMLEGLNVLIADDEELNYFLLEEYLSDSGANLIYAVNGLDAVNKCRASRVDLILMDIRMPVMDGIEATKEIKQFKKVPIIAISAYIFDIEKKKIKDVGFDIYIEKPVNPNILYDHIKKVMSLYSNN